MARMKTGRLTTKTTPPQKNNGGTPNKVQWADPKNPPKASNQAEWDKYDQDYKAYKNYDNEVNAYNKQMEAYKKSKLKGPADYRALDSGNTSSSNMRKLDPSELSEFNAYMKKNNLQNTPEGKAYLQKNTSVPTKVDTTPVAFQAPWQKNNAAQFKNIHFFPIFFNCVNKKI